MLKKIKRLSQLQNIVGQFKSEGKTVVFTNGCFDLIHPGHIMYLCEAKEMGDLLIVGLNSDASIRKIKGKDRPIINEAGRITILSGLECVDYIAVFDESTPLKLIKTLKPDIIVKGADWKDKGIIGADFVRSYGGEVRTVNLVKGYSTTNLIKKIVQRFK